MNYDKNSFLTGVAVGRQLRGWSVAGAGEAALAVPTLCVNAAQPLALTLTLSGGPAAAVSVTEMERQ